MEKDPGLSKSALARSLGVSRGSLYHRPVRPAKDKAVMEAILPVMREHPSYGSRRIAAVLGANRKRVARVMRRYGLAAIRRRKRPKPSPAAEGGPKVPNRMKGSCPIRPDAVWAGDFTYIRWQGIFVYLATVADRFTSEVVGWSIGVRHSAALVVEALGHAASRRPSLPAVFHSDQGSEYASEACLSWLAERNVLPSWSRKGKPWENGAQESFFRYFKEDPGDVRRFAGPEALAEALHAGIRYHNERRIHSAFGTPPAVFRARWGGRRGGKAHNGPHQMQENQGELRCTKNGVLSSRPEGRLGPSFCRS
jgi:putative transposase